jgi:hypothetical protein
VAILAKVTGDLDVPRGPDVVLSIFVHPDWLGREVEVSIPRNVHCAACEGGGCDGCNRTGAITLQGSGEEPTVVALGLPDAEVKGESGLVIRLPDLGGSSAEPGRPRGHLLLRVVCTSDTAKLTTGPAVTLLRSGPGRMHHDERVALAKRSLIMAVVVTLLFLGMLRLSGWL